MKKSKIIVILLVISLITVSLYQTLATDITMSKTNVEGVDLSYTFNIRDLPVKFISVSPGTTKVFDFFLTNPNNGTIKYGITYKHMLGNCYSCTVAELSTSKDRASGLINKNETKQITIVIENNTTSSASAVFSFAAILGYEHGGDLIIPDGASLITDTYFYPVNAADYIESLFPSNPTTMNNDDPDGNVRYMGKDPNNYVKFNNELWRIIGVFDVKQSESGQPEKRLKIINPGRLKYPRWDDNNTNDWSQSTFQIELNDTYLNSLTTEAQNQVGDTYWNLGGTINGGLASNFYEYERGVEVYSGRPTYWVGKIGLIYPSDYGYATSGGTTIDRLSCLNTNLSSWIVGGNFEECSSNNYINTGSWNWTITPYSGNFSDVFLSASNIFYYNANLADDTGDLYLPALVETSPALYLKSTVEITGGTGTRDDPYTLR